MGSSKIFKEPTVVNSSLAGLADYADVHFVRRLQAEIRNYEPQTSSNFRYFLYF